MNRRGEKRECAGREKSLSFTKSNKRDSNIGEQVIVISFLENRWKRLHIFGKSSVLDLEPSTMIQTSLFLTSTDVRVRKYSSMFGFPWEKIHW